MGNYLTEAARINVADETSAPSRSHYGVKPLQFDPGVGGRELPISLGVLLIPDCLPCRDFADEFFFVGNAPVQALRGHDTELGLSHVQPAPVFGRVVPFEPLNQAPGLIGWERLIK